MRHRERIKESENFIIENFVSSMDMNLNIWVHINNAQRDAKLYMWKQKFLERILDAIFEAYKVTPIEVITIRN